MHTLTHTLTQQRKFRPILNGIFETREKRKYRNERVRKKKCSPWDENDFVTMRINMRQ